MLAKDLSMVNMGLCLNWVHLGSTSHMLTFSSSLFPQAFTSHIDSFNSPFHHAFSSYVWHILNLLLDNFVQPDKINTSSVILYVYY
jgi:hypothetical protein